ncbi:histidine kinase [Enterococcus faecium]|nr:histidine kinase [Enterococcus faecium]EMF0482577.1 histidine kinase [Enterococcus faecium]
MDLKDGIKIIIQDVVEPEPEKEGCLTKIGSFIVAMVVIVGLLSLLFRFLMNHPFVLIVGIAVIVFFLVQASKK